MNKNVKAAGITALVVSSLALAGFAFVKLYEAFPNVFMPVWLTAVGIWMTVSIYNTVKSDLK